jgi:sugar lactone lactonase YvrE
MRRQLRRTVVTALLLPPLLLAGVAPATAHDGAHDRARNGARNGARDLPTTYPLSGDAGGSTFEGIDVVRDRETFYVTETTGGEIHRGGLDEVRTEVWLDEDAAVRDDRRAAVGIATDRSGRVYVAGGANRTQVPGDSPDFWVYDDDRDLLAALRMPVEGDLFLNDVVIGPDGAAYVTDSTTPRIFRIARENGTWEATVWASPTAPVAPTRGPRFGLNGIEVAREGRSLVVVQSDVGALWRYDLATARPTRIGIGNADVTSGDGLVIEGRTLVVVRNQPHRLAYLRLSRDATSARLLAQVPTPADRFLTTGAAARGQLLLVDSQFDETPPSRDSEVVTMRSRR